MTGTMPLSKRIAWLSCRVLGMRRYARCWSLMA